MSKDKIFWYIIIPWVIILTLIISLSPWLFELLATPSDRTFSGINRWSTDYFIYLSYIEQGKRGWLAIKLLLTTAQHAALFSHLSYTIPGFILGKILGLNSIFIYHFMRAIYGLVFLLITAIFFYRLSKSKFITLLAFFFSFFISGSAEHLGWLQEQNIIGRASGPLHYSTGFIVFLTTFLYFFYSKHFLIKKAVIFGILLNLLLLTNPFNYLVIGLSYAIYFIFRIFIDVKNANLSLWHAWPPTKEKKSKSTSLLHKRKDVFEQLKKDFLILLFGFLLSLPIFFYLNYHLTTSPWGVVGVSPKFYVVTTPPISFWEVALSVGPIFFLAIIYLFTIKQWNNKTIFLIIWPTIQFLLLLFGNQLKIHPPRAFSGLYYLPLAYFSAIFINKLSFFIKKKLKVNYWKLNTLLLTTLFLLTLPNFIQFYKQHLYAFTDFKAFSTFAYPTKKQVEAYLFLEKNSPTGTGVLAMFEASNHLIGFSGNSTELAMEHQIKLKFYSNQMTIKEAIKFLKDNHFKYIYWGTQEQSAGGNANKYPFLNKIFDNEEVKIYQVKDYN